MMKTKYRLRHFFNMIEVSLALGVTAVGVLGAVTVLPVALKTTNTAVYSAYLSDAANMVFMGLDRYLNENCYNIDYEKEHKTGTTAAELEKIYQERRQKFADIFYPNEKNAEAAKRLNDVLDVTQSGGEGVHILHQKQDNYGLIAFYPETPKAFVTLEDYSGSFLSNIGRPLFAVMYRIVVTDLETDEEYYIDGFRQLVEVKTPPVTKKWTDPRTGETHTVSVPGARAAGTKRYSLTGNEKKLMKRVYVEFSWPVNAAYENRTKKTFIREYYMTD